MYELLLLQAIYFSTAGAQTYLQMEAYPSQVGILQMNLGIYSRILAYAGFPTIWVKLEVLCQQ